MTLDQLRVFVAVAERRHMTKAAAVLGMTQSAASAASRVARAPLWDEAVQPGRPRYRAE